MPWFADGDPTFSPAKMPAAVNGHGYCEQGGKIWAFGGLDDEWNPTAGVYSYDPTSNTWETHTALANADSAYGKFAAIDDLIYGMDTTAGNFFSYDTASGTQTTLTPPTAGVDWGYDLVLHDGKIYWQMSGPSPCRYDPGTGSWESLTAIDDLVGNGKTGSSVSDGTHIWVLLDGAPQRYDPSTDSWQAGFTSTSDGVSLLIDWGVLLHHDGSLILVGGENWAVDAPTAAHLAYDIAGDTWTAEDSLEQARSDLGAVIYNDRIYAFGGWDAGPAFLDTLEVYVLSSALAELENSYHVLHDRIRGAYANQPAIVWLRNTYDNPEAAKATLTGLYDSRPATAALTNRYGNVTPVTFPARARVQVGVKLS